MATYSAIQTEVRANIIDLPTTVTNAVPDIVNQAIRKIQEDHNFYIMEALTTAATTAAATRVLSAAPSDFKEFRGDPYYVEDDGDRVDMAIAPDREAAERAFSVDDTNDIGEPCLLLLSEPSDDDGTRNFEVFPYSDGASDYSDGEYRVRVPYWKYLADLSADDDSNWFTVNAVDYVVFKATADGFWKDWDEERATVWEQRAASEKARVIKADKLLRMSTTDTLAVHKGARAVKIGA